MASPDISTAYILNNLLLQVDQVAVAQDLAFSQEEFSLGQPLATRQQDLCWGYAPVPASTSGDAGKLLVVGTGITRNGTGALNTKNSAQQALALVDLLTGGVAFQDAYAFGSVYLVPGGSMGDAPTITPLLVTGANGTGSPLLIGRTVDQDAAVEWLRSGVVPAATSPAANSLEIMKFVLDITLYQSGHDATNMVEAVILDQRIPRGWGGYADEIMAIFLTTNIIQRRDDFDQTASEIQSLIRDLILSWVYLTSWTPTFVDYWNTNASLMPLRLKQYLAKEFGLTF